MMYVICEDIIIHAIFMPRLVGNDKHIFLKNFGDRRKAT